MGETYVDKAAAALQRELKARRSSCPSDLVEFYTLLVLARGERVSLEDVHDAWAVWRIRTAPEHRSLIPFDDLSTDVQDLDEPYRAAIAGAAQALPQSEGHA